jgi:hypothetical protein
MSAKKLWAIDIDGTVADNSHRTHLILSLDPDWDSFFNLMWTDRPIEAARRHFEGGSFKHGPHVILTARPEYTRENTTRWLIEHGFATESTKIYMKPDLIRFQHSQIFKRSALEVLAATEFVGHEITLIEDQLKIRKALEGTEFKTLAAPECWEDACWT